MVYIITKVDANVSKELLDASDNSKKSIQSILTKET